MSVYSVCIMELVDVPFSACVDFIGFSIHSFTSSIVTMKVRNHVMHRMTKQHNLAFMLLKISGSVFL